MKNCFIWGIILLILTSCSNSVNTKEEIVIDGYAQGTTYTVRYISFDGVNHQRAIDSILIAIDNSLSTYNNRSLITKVNKTDKAILVDSLFINVFEAAKKVHQQSNGLFDPTVCNIVNAWGFGFTEIPNVDSLLIDSLKLDVGLDKITLNNKGEIVKQNKTVIIDFNAIAQGYTVDVIADYLESKSVYNYMVEVGGELKVKGNNMKGTLWRIGIDKPIENLEVRTIYAIINLEDKAMATSGNYRKFYEKDGMKYSHTINPKTGYPVEHNLLSVTVVTSSCMYADAYATAFMVMGYEKTKQFVEQHSDIEVIMIYQDVDMSLKTYVSDNLKNFVEEQS